jgi:hypothetical protein
MNLIVSARHVSVSVGLSLDICIPVSFAAIFALLITISHCSHPLVWH